MGGMKRGLLISLVLAVSPVWAQPPGPSSPEVEIPGPVGVDILPPLSLSDAQWLINRAQLMLERHGEEDTTADLRLVRMMVLCVNDYVQLCVQRRSSLADVPPVYLGKDTLAVGGEVCEIAVTPALPVANVQAVALGCTRERVEVRTIVVETETGETITLRPSLTLDPDLPGRSVVELPRLITVAQVVVSAVAQTWEEGRPRLKVWGVQLLRPEHLRDSLMHLAEARVALDEEDEDRAAAALELARRLITQAEENEAL